jgi:hypothetical protein
MHPRRSFRRAGGGIRVRLCAVIGVGSDPDLSRIVTINIAVVVVFFNTLGGQFQGRRGLRNDSIAQLWLLAG